MPDRKAPVDDVGGRQDSGPWPSDVQEIAEGKVYNRPVQVGEGQLVDLDVTVKSVDPIIRDDGTETDGYVVSYEYDDPTAGGGI